MKFKIGDIVIFNHITNKESYRNNSKARVVKIIKGNLIHFPYVIKFNDNHCYRADESELTLAVEKKNYLPKWW